MSHEPLQRREPTSPPSERSFAVVFTAFFSLVALWPLVKGRPWRPWALVVAAIFLSVGMVRPSLLRLPNLLWFRLAELLHRIVSPIVMGVLYYCVMTPCALIVRWTGRDPLHLRRDSSASTYWIDRVPPGPDPKSMAEQF